ncbi:hypothetical protein J6590_059415 [Homalodisca vitripennis]|nr:hypothetical protein J6590_059415 [Homalodisca vitripennis]
MVSQRNRRQREKLLRNTARLRDTTIVSRIEGRTITTKDFSRSGTFLSLSVSWKSFVTGTFTVTSRAPERNSPYRKSVHDSYLR